MSNPKLKVDEYLLKLSEKFNAWEAIDDDKFNKIINDLKYDFSVRAIATKAMANAVHSNIKQAIVLMERCLNGADASFVGLYCAFLNRDGQIEKERDTIYDAANKYPNKSLKYSAVDMAYCLGNLSLCGELMDKHIRLLSDEEGRQSAMKHKDDLLHELRYAYEESQCSPKQFELIGIIIKKIMSRYAFSKSTIEISGRDGGDYVIDLLDTGVDTIAEMNGVLAQEICADERLDNCRLIARFSPDRNLKPMVSYFYN